MSANTQNRFVSIFIYGRLCWCWLKTVGSVYFQRWPKYIYFLFCRVFVRKDINYRNKTSIYFFVTISWQFWKQSPLFQLFIFSCSETQFFEMPFCDLKWVQKVLILFIPVWRAFKKKLFFNIYFFMNQQFAYCIKSYLIAVFISKDKYICHRSILSLTLTHTVPRPPYAPIYCRIRPVTVEVQFI